MTTMYIEQKDDWHVLDESEKIVIYYWLSTNRHIYHLNNRYMLYRTKMEWRRDVK